MKTTYFAWSLNCVSVSITFSIAVLQISAAEPVRVHLWGHMMGIITTCLVSQNSLPVSQHAIGP